MLPLVLALALFSVGETTPAKNEDKLYYPRPEIGFGMSLFPQFKKDSKGDYVKDANNTRITYIRKYLHLGLPFPIKKLDWYYDEARLMIHPGVLFSSKTFLLSLGIGPDIVNKLGYRQWPSAFFWGLCGGLYTGFVNGGSSSGADSDQYMYGAFAKIYGGPEFDISEAYRIRLGFNAQFYLGTVREQTFRFGDNNKMGLTGSVYGQLFY